VVVKTGHSSGGVYCVCVAAPRYGRPLQVSMYDITRKRICTLLERERRNSDRSKFCMFWCPEFFWGKAPKCALLFYFNVPAL